MTKADIVFKEYIRKIMEEGVWSEQARQIQGWQNCQLQVHYWSLYGI